MDHSDEMPDIEARNRAIYEESAENRVVPDDAD